MNGDRAGDAPRLRVTYRLTGSEAEAAAKARDVCVEQTVEFPEDLLPPDLAERIVGRVESLDRIGPEVFEAVVGFAPETVGSELTQILNVLFGNASIKRGIRLVRFELPEDLLGRFRGPRFGREGLRRIVGAPARPLLCTAIKPMGLSADELADLAYSFALGGIDIVKDDHGLADQPGCPFEERVERAAAAVAKANEQTGGRCLYFPNVTAPADAIADRVCFAKDAGAGGLLISPGLTGFDAMRRLADDDAIALPILGHPALLGSYVVHSDHGISHFALFGEVFRLAGADACIFPSFGGRFSFTPDECREIVEGTIAPMGTIAPAFPVPAGGMGLDRVRELRAFYGSDVILLIGGDLHRHGPDLTSACREFRRLVEDGDGP